MKKYIYIFHFISGQSYVLTASKSLGLAEFTSRPWFFINEWGGPSYCNNGGVAINTNNVEFIEVEVLDEK